MKRVIAGLVRATGFSRCDGR